MFDETRRLGFSRRQLEKRSITNRVHAYYPLNETAQFAALKDYLKFMPERRPHAAYLHYRPVHPCYFYAGYSHSKPRRERVLIAKESGLVKSLRHSPRAMRTRDQILRESETGLPGE